ncbi:general substrate transporter [Boeremia exigua]|uniref:general substrate transporter n=1 Tax=Boeremia exigua TaxID=749465 RepID=UPI001E8DC82E|nr:general substrate transporter [Boeremia exigua]KAH6638432.1 general substrate transporter [Boeremia exigua]
MVALKETSLWANRKCLAICAIVSIANMQYGIDTAAVGGFQAMPGFLKVFGFEDPTSPFGYGIDSTVQQLMTSLMSLGSFVSAISAGLFSKYFGRKTGLWLACILNAIAVAIQVGSSSAGALYVGRLILGLANGYLTTFSTVYATEAAPAHLRGVLVALFAYYVNFGSIIGSLIDNYTKSYMDKRSYRIPLACLYIVPTILAIGLFFVPESPRWLLHRGQTEEARESLMRMREDHGEELELEWSEMLRGVEEETRLAKTTSFMDMFRGNDLRRTLLSYGMIASQTASGVWFFIGYQTYFFSIAGITKAFEYSIMNACIGWFGVHCGIYAMKRWVGRRSLIIFGALTCGFCELACGIAASVSPNSIATGNVLVAFTALFMFFYDACVGVASFPMANELVSSRLRAWTVGSANALGYFLAWLVGFCSPYFVNPQDLNWGPKYTYIWAGSNFLCVIFFYFCVPEPKGRSLEELDEIFEAKVSARSFPAYKCQIVETARQDVYASREVEIPKQETEA